MNMETITVEVGTVQRIGSIVQDERRPVEFVGEQLARMTTCTGDDDTRGVTETLYRAEAGRLLVYIEDWSHWQGESSSYFLRQVTEDDLGVGGEFEHLGREAGFGRPLTLDEVLGDE